MAESSLTVLTCTENLQCTVQCKGPEFSEILKSAGTEDHRRFAGLFDECGCKAVSTVGLDHWNRVPNRRAS